MIGILLLSHGDMAKGMVNSCKLFFGEDIPQISSATLQVGDSVEKFDELLENKIKEVDSGDGVICLVDLLGGTPSNRSILVMNEKIKVITGMNFTMLLELLGRRLTVSDISELDINELISTSKDGIVLLNDKIQMQQEDLDLEPLE